MANLSPNRVMPGDPFAHMEIKSMRIAEATSAYIRFKITHLPTSEIDSLINWLSNVKEHLANGR